MFGLEICREEWGSSPSSVLRDQGAQVCRQVWIAAGACNWEMCYEETSYRWQISQFTARGRTAGFSSGFVVRCMGRIFCEKQSHRGAWTTCNGTRKAGKGLQCFAQERCLYNTEALRKKIEFPLYSLVIKLFVIRTWFYLNSLED